MITSATGYAGKALIRYAYVRNDGERFLITIFPDTHSVDEVMWVFAKEDTSSEE